jgi:DNA-binding NarL/FixJ family response regulator
MKNILILESHEIALASLSSFIHDKIEQIEVHRAMDFETAIGCMEQNKIDVLLWSLNSPDDIAVLPKEIERGVVIMLFYRDLDVALQLTRLHSKVKGIVSKAAKPAELVHCLEMMFRDEVYYCEATLYDAINLYVIPGKTALSLSSTTSVRKSPTALSKREKQVYDLLIRGKGTSKIAAILGLKPSTISTMKAQILQKMNVSNVIELLG